jgi:hypothetical protein
MPYLVFIIILVRIMSKPKSAYSLIAIELKYSIWYENQQREMEQIILKIENSVTIPEIETNNCFAEFLQLEKAFLIYCNIQKKIKIFQSFS